MIFPLFVNFLGVITEADKKEVVLLNSLFQAF